MPARCPNCGVFIISASPAPQPVHLICEDLSLACGHAGRDPSSSVREEVTCSRCLALTASGVA